MDIYMNIYTTYTHKLKTSNSPNVVQIMSKAFRKCGLWFHFCCCDEKLWQRQHSRRMDLFALVVQVTVPHRGKSGQGLSQELGAGLLAAPHDSAFNHGTHSKNSTVETTQECCLGAHGPAYTQLGSFYRQDHLPSDGTAHMRWSLPYHSTVRKSPPQTCPRPAWSSQFLIGDSPLRWQIHSANQNYSVKTDVT